MKNELNRKPINPIFLFLLIKVNSLKLLFKFFYNKVKKAILTENYKYASKK